LEQSKATKELDKIVDDVLAGFDFAKEKMYAGCKNKS